MDGFVRGERITLQEGRSTPTDLPELPREVDAESTAAYIRAVLQGRKPIPNPWRCRWNTSCDWRRMNTGKVTLVGAGPATRNC